MFPSAGSPTKYSTMLLSDERGLLTGRSVRLRPVLDSDIDVLYTIACLGSVSSHWRYRGHIPHPEQFRADLFSDILVHYVSTPTQSSADVFGYLAASRYSPADGVVHISAMFAPPAQRSISSSHALVMFCNSVFAGWDIRKLLIEVPAFNLPSLNAGFHSGLLTEEGVLRQHLFVGGEFHDVHLLCIWRADWEPWFLKIRRTIF